MAAGHPRPSEKTDCGCLARFAAAAKVLLGFRNNADACRKSCLDSAETLFPGGSSVLASQKPAVLVLASQKLCFLAEAEFSDGLCLFGRFGQGLFERFGQQSAVREVGVVAVLYLQAVLPQAFGQLFCAVGRYGAGNGFAVG